jgi:hypothetical protein
MCYVEIKKICICIVIGCGGRVRRHLDYCILLCVYTYLPNVFLTIIEFVITFLTIIKFCGRKKKVGGCLIVQKQDIQVLFHLFLTNDTFDLLLPNPIG